MNDVRPTLDKNGVPCCAREECPSYDGKRCSATGFRPDGICEPAVIEMAALARVGRAYVDRVAAERVWVRAPSADREAMHLAQDVLGNATDALAAALAAYRAATEPAP